MQFPRGVIKVGIPLQGLTTQSQHDSDMPFLFPTRNQLQTLSTRHTSSCFQIQNGFGVVDSSEMDPRTNSQQEYHVKVAEQIRLELDDLSAVVGKCNVNPVLSVGDDGRRLSNSCPAQYQEEVIWDSHSCDNKGLLPSTSKPRKVNGEEPLKSLKRKRSVNGNLVPGSVVRKSHVLSERLRRREMNDLFAEMRSLLPNPKAKSDKASILSETMSYIQFLQRRLALVSTDRSKLPIKLESMSSVPKANEASWDEHLSLKYNGRDIFITIIDVKKRNLLSSIILVVESLNIQVMDAFLSVTNNVALHFLHLKAADILDHVVRETLRGTLSKLIESEYQICFQQSEKAKICDASA